jgi:hypothetical protein
MGFMLHPEDALAPPDALLRQVPAYPSEPEVLKGFWPPKDARHGRGCGRYSPSEAWSVCGSGSPVTRSPGSSRVVRLNVGGHRMP